MYVNIHKRKKKTSEDSDGEDDSDDLVQTNKEKIYFYAEVTKKTVLQLLCALTECSEYALIHDKSHIIMYIHSGGGDAYAGLSAMDHMMCNKVPIITVVDGFVASAATFMLLGAKRRFGMPHSNILIHQLSTEFWGKYADLVDEMHNSRALMEQIKQIYLRETKLDEGTLLQLLSKEITMNVQEAKTHGFLTCVEMIQK